MSGRCHPSADSVSPCTARSVRFTETPTGPRLPCRLIAEMIPRCPYRTNQFPITIHIRQARVDDLPALTAVRYHDHPAIHRDRIDAFDPNRLYYFVAAFKRQIVG